MSGYLSVRDFDHLQHYKDRRPPWIKLYNALLDDYAFACLPDASKAHLLGIFLLASRHRNRIPNDAEWIGRMIHATSPVDVETLVSSGFLTLYQDASTTHPEWDESQAERPDSAIPEREGEKERERSKSVGEQNVENSGENSESVPPPPELEASIRSLFQDFGERSVVASRSLSIPKTLDGQQREVLGFLCKRFPPKNITALYSREVMEWTGRIPWERSAAAVREITRSPYPPLNGNGDERRWKDLSDAEQQRVVLDVFNGMYRQHTPERHEIQPAKEAHA